MFEACSNNDTSTPTPPAGPATIGISGIALGQGFVDGAGASPILACDYTIGVNVETTNWKLLGPGRCGGALQCGQLRVSLLDGPDGTALLMPLIAAGNGVALDVSSLVPPTDPMTPRSYVIKVELVDDSGNAYVAVDGGNGSAQQGFEMAFPSNCGSHAGAAGAGGAGAGGDGETAGTAGSAESGGGTAEIAGNGGTGGAAGNAGNGGTGGTAGNAGS